MLIGTARDPGVAQLYQYNNRNAQTGHRASTGNMEDPTRRHLLETAGAGAGIALGAGAVTARKETAVTAQAAGSFTATGTDGFLTSNGSDPIPGDGDESGGTRFPLAGDGVDGDFTIEGEVFSDGTWESTSTTLPSFSRTEDSGNIFFGDITISVDYDIDGTVTGTIDRTGGTMTGQLPLRITLEVSDFPGGPATGTIAADATDLTTGTSNGSGTEQGMQGSASNLDTTAGSATLVDNVLTLPATGTDLIDSVFSLPSQTEGRNWVSLSMELSLPALTGTIAGTVTDGTDSLANVSVEVLDPDTGSTVTTVSTDSAGAYAAAVDPGTYDILVDSDGFAPFETTVSVEGDATSTVDIALDALPVLGPNPPADSDGDGLYEDIRGDGSVDMLDVQALFTNLDNPAVQANADLFNFQGDDPDEVGVLDVQALYDTFL